MIFSPNTLAARITSRLSLRVTSAVVPKYFLLLLTLSLAWPQSASAENYLPHPKGCPAKRFCACGASVKVFGKSIRSLWPSRAWLKFPRSTPGHKRVAVKPGHVFVIDYMIDGKTAMAWDFNSGGRKSRYHRRSIVGFRIVNPYASNVAMGE